MELAGRVRRAVSAAGLSTEDLVITTAHDRVRLVCSQGHERALAYAGDVLALYGFTVTPGIEPWYLIVTKEN